MRGDLLERCLTHQARTLVASGCLMLIIGRPIPMWLQLTITSGFLLLSFLWEWTCGEARMQRPNDPSSATRPTGGAS